MISELQRRLINRFQGGLPLVERPYAGMARALACSEDELLGNLQQMLDQGTLSRFGPLYDAVRLGGGLTLAALSVPQNRFAEVTRQVNAFEEVAHNYQREHALNMWFVLATGDPRQVNTTLQDIACKTRLPVYDFRKLEEFYVGLWLDLQNDGAVNTVPLTDHESSAQHEYLVDDIDRQIVRQTQAGLLLESDPWQGIADRAGIDRSTLMQRLQAMLSAGVIRRIGAVPNHYRLGLKANGMTVWDVPDDLTREAGEMIGKLDFVSHCYLRPRHPPLWRYNLFAMVHGHDRAQVEGKTTRIAQLLGPRSLAHEVLFSCAILKKTGMRLAA
jgi:DNA-binding Lrp family transcriptional regulator